MTGKKRIWKTLVVLLLMLAVWTVPVGVLANADSSLGESNSETENLQPGNGNSSDIAFEVPASGRSGNSPSAIFLAVLLVGVCAFFVIEGIVSYLVKARRRWNDKFL